MLHLLYVEDDPADFALLQHNLQRQGMVAELVRVDTLAQVSAALEARQWDAILADYKLPGLAFGELRALVRERVPDCPLILVSGAVGEETAIELLKDGVWDFVLKDKLGRLCPVIERSLRDSAQRRARHAAERALQESEARFRLIAATITEAIWMAEAGLGPVLYVSPAYEHIWQRPCAALYENPRAFLDDIHADDRARVTEEILSAQAAGLAFRHEYRVVRPDGSIRWVMDRGFPALSPADSPGRYVGVIEDITERRRAEERLLRLAHYDALTDLPNRLLLQSRLEQALERAQREGSLAAVLFIDLDRFKTVNDSLGHIVGDRLLVDVARRLHECVGDEGILGRFGGDEFLLLLEPLPNPDKAAAVAHKLLSTLTMPFAVGDSNEAYIDASIGISVFPGDGTGSVDLLRNADAAMYRAKEQGRNCICFYTPDMNADAVAQLELEAALRRALERGQFVLHYQPKVDLRTGQVLGAEALIRWQREADRLESPARFIPLAEKTGLIVPIGTWVIDAACRQLRSWHDAGRPELVLAVNVSGRQFYSGDLPQIVEQAVARHGIPATCLELEVTESVLMENPEQTVAILRALKRIGVRLSLDDFGTGYSSFAYLNRFPIDTLKIDQSFVRSIVTEPEAAMIAVSIIDLAHRMRLTVVAEGVETEAQLGFLRMRGCDEMQGYLFARPMPAEDFDALMRDGASASLLPASAQTAERTLLLVDDEPNVLASLRRLLAREGYRILTAGGGREGLELLATHPVQVILSDQRMPQMTGTDFLSRVKDLHPDTVRIVLSGYTDLESVTRAVNEGAIYKFLCKPWDNELLRGHIRDAFLYHEAVIRPRTERDRAEASD